ncbi:hypothetical protein T484DRAFT_1861670 [Baffinella frigidus]|nr:hypothetical protein T484DRAFT_1861670 [Cryptophyta sp. CCMP2293]
MAPDNMEDPHCAYCLTPLDVPIRCADCNTRAYCGRPCLRDDLEGGKGPHFPGGQHATWCGARLLARAGEQGVDWDTRRISDAKGRGLVAIRAFPKGTRVLVDRCLSEAHVTDEEEFPGDVGEDLNLLAPREGTLREKFLKNSFADGKDGVRVLSLLLSLTNHSCDPNAQARFIEGVKSLFALRDIHPGEEITTNYCPLDPLGTSTGASARSELARVWGITCHATCVCRDARRAALLAAAQSLHQRLATWLALHLTASFSKMAGLRAPAARRRSSMDALAGVILQEASDKLAAYRSVSGDDHGWESPHASLTRRDSLLRAAAPGAASEARPATSAGSTPSSPHSSLARRGSLKSAAAARPATSAGSTPSTSPNASLTRRDSLLRSTPGAATEAPERPKTSAGSTPHASLTRRDSLMRAAAAASEAGRPAAAASEGSERSPLASPHASITKRDALKRAERPHEEEEEEEEEEEH